jgi:hypothetical protein
MATKLKIKNFLSICAPDMFPILKEVTPTGSPFGGTT